MFGLLRRQKEKWVKQRLSLYLDGRLDAVARTKVESHLKGCPACREEMESLRATIETLHHLPLVVPPRSFALPALKPWPASGPPHPTAFPRLRLATTAVAALLALLVVGDALGLFLRSGTPQSPTTPLPALATLPTPIPTPMPTLNPQEAPRQAEKAKGLAALSLEEGGQALLAPVPSPQPPSAPTGPAPEPAAPSPALSPAPVYRGPVKQLELVLGALTLLLSLATAYAWRQGKKIFMRKEENQ